MNTQQKFDWTDARVAELKDLHKAGLSAGQIAARLGGITRNAVIGKVLRMKLGPLTGSVPKRKLKPRSDLPATKGVWTEQAIETAARLWARGDNGHEIAEAIGKTKDQLMRYASMHRDLFPARDRGRQRAQAHRAKTTQPEYIAPQFLVPPEGYDAERMEHAKELHDLEARECKWPYGNGPFRFCAAETEIGATYCHHHRMRARPKVLEVRA